MTGISGDGPRLTINLAQVDDLNLEKRAYFKTPEDRVAFLDAIKNAREQVAKGILNPTLEIPQPSNARSLGIVADKFDSSAILVGGTLLDVMTILHDLGQQLRQTAKDSRAVAREAEVDKLEAAASKIREGAMVALAAGVVGGAFTIAGGVMSGVGAAKSGFTAYKGAAAGNVANTQLTQNLTGTNPTGTGLTGTGTGTGTGTTPTSQIQIGSHRGGVGPTPTSQIQIGGHRAGPIGTTTPTGTQGTSGPGGTGGTGGTPTGTGTTGPGSNTGTPQTVAETRTGQVQKQGMLADLRDKLLSSKASGMAEQNPGLANALATSQLEAWKAGSMVLSGMGQMASAGLDAAGKMKDADRAMLEAEAKGYGYAAQNADEIVQKMLELMRDVRQKLGEIEQAQSQVQSKIWS